MDEKKEKKEESAWFSTYGLLTAERLLERFGIHLPQDELIRAVKDPDSIYYKLLRVPLKNVFNGIILQQVHDYQIYAQKLFVDYLLSGEDAKDKDAPGGMTREDLEVQRQNLIEIGDAFHALEEEHQILIAESQASLIGLSHDLDSLLQTVAANSEVVEQQLSEFLERTEYLNINLRSYRSQFYNLIIRVTEFIKLLPDYRTDQIKEAANREILAFDSLIGGE